MKHFVDAAPRYRTHGSHNDYLHAGNLASTCCAARRPQLEASSISGMPPEPGAVCKATRRPVTLIPFHYRQTCGGKPAAAAETYIGPRRTASQGLLLGLSLPPCSTRSRRPQQGRGSRSDNFAYLVDTYRARLQTQLLLNGSRSRWFHAAGGTSGRRDEGDASGFLRIFTRKGLPPLDGGSALRATAPAGRACNGGLKLDAAGPRYGTPVTPPEPASWEDRATTAQRPAIEVYLATCRPARKAAGTSPPAGWDQAYAGSSVTPPIAGGPQTPPRSTISGQTILGPAPAMR